ncbi:hypothetical protein FACS1894164_11690 [Spirochaetia bacterium]|nr:hypothetical protein FACS1894164_11690 [Spirochaetia bacterium]
MSNNVQLVPYYSGDSDYRDYMVEVASAMVDDISAATVATGAMASAKITQAIEEQTYAVVGSQEAIARNITATNRYLLSGFSGLAAQNAQLSREVSSGFSELSYQMGKLGSTFAIGFARTIDTMRESSQAICDKLDAINENVSNPFLVKSRELYRRALVSYTKGFYEEAVEDLNEAIKINKTDYISWFLLGKTYLFGAGEFSCVIDLDASITALSSAAKYIKPDTAGYSEARLMASEICFYLGLARQTKAKELLVFKHKDDGVQSLIAETQRAFEQSYTYSNDMLESRYNTARCKVLLGDTHSALQDLESIIPRDKIYAVKPITDPDFGPILDDFYELLRRLAVDLYRQQAKPLCDALFDEIQHYEARYGALPIELAQEMPKETLPYLDMFDAVANLLFLKKKLEQQAEQARQAALAEQKRQAFLKKFVYISAGTFMMGSPKGEPDRSSDETQHQVRISRDFYMSKCEVTQKEYQEVMRTNPSYFEGDNLPVEQVSWYDAIEYCNAKSLKEGLTPAYTIDKSRKDPNNRADDDDLKWVVTWSRSANGYRLPTEAEWEYACRGGTATPFSTGNNITTDQANYNGNYPYNGNATGTNREKTTPVGSFTANAWGLYDMHGNVWEWCWDWKGDYSSSSQTDPSGVASGTYRVLRGGEWNLGARALRSALRNYRDATSRYNYVGFRVVRP